MHRATMSTYNDEIRNDPEIKFVTEETSTRQIRNEIRKSHERPSRETARGKST